MLGGYDGFRFLSAFHRLGTHVSPPNRQRNPWQPPSGNYHTGFSLLQRPEEKGTISTTEQVAWRYRSLFTPSAPLRVHDR
jgi:hypothetical protein